MLPDFVKSAVLKIIDQQKSLDIDWKSIEDISLDTIGIINSKNVSIDMEIYKFLDDWDVRQKDNKYLEYQTKKVEKVLSTNYSE